MLVQRKARPITATLPPNPLQAAIGPPRPRRTARFWQLALHIGTFSLVALSLVACVAAPQAAVLPPATPFSVAAVVPAIPAPPVPAPSAPSLRPSVLVPTIAPVSPTPQPSPSPSATPIVLTQAMREQIFNEIWTTINEHYLYPEFGGVDWAAVRVEFEPRVAQATSDESFYNLVADMVARLGDDHSRFLPPHAAQRQDALSSGREEQVGIGAVVLPLHDGLLIEQVFPDSPAQRAGLRPRDRIVAIDGLFYADAALEGPEGSPVRLTVVRPGVESRDVLLIRKRVEGRIGPIARRLPNDIGYLNITTLWVNDMDTQVSAALADVVAPQPLRGLILDLRSNPGGWRSVLTGILAHFVSGPVGTFTSRLQNTPLLIEPGASPDLRGLPLVVLVDHGTASYAELIAAVLQSNAGAVVLGTPSAGNTETIYSYELSGGARLWVAQEGFRLPDGGTLEGVGVRPDIPVFDDWTHFSEADDPALKVALHLLTPSAGGK